MKSKILYNRNERFESVFPVDDAVGVACGYGVHTVQVHKIKVNGAPKYFVSHKVVMDDGGGDTYFDRMYFLPSKDEADAIGRGVDLFRQNQGLYISPHENRKTHPCYKGEWVDAKEVDVENLPVGTVVRGELHWGEMTITEPINDIGQYAVSKNSFGDAIHHGRIKYVFKPKQ